MFAFVLALIFIYLVLSAQFESFRDPLIIMFTVPLALIGAMVSLWYFDQTMNIFSLPLLIADNFDRIIRFQRPGDTTIQCNFNLGRRKPWNKK